MLAIKGLCKSMKNSCGTKQEIFQSTDISVDAGEFLSIVAPSGSGKTTLLNICALLDEPDDGCIYWENKLIGDFKSPKLESSERYKRNIARSACNTKVDSFKSSTLIYNLRKKNLGFIFQSHLLIGTLTVLQNLMVPLIINKHKNAKEKAIDLLEKFGIIDLAIKYPQELSGGQQQRIAILRGIIHKPKLILADEPTGNLDEENSSLIIQEFLELCKHNNIAIILVTHNLEIAKKTDRILTIQHHKIVPHGCIK